MRKSFSILLGCTLFVIAVNTIKGDGGVSKPIFTPATIKAPFVEQFTDDWTTRWRTSEATKVITNEKTGLQDEEEEAEKSPEKFEFKFNGNWSVEEPTVFPGFSFDKGLVVKSPATHHAIAARFPNAIDPKDKTLVVQYEVKFQNLLECGGAYLKLITKQDKPFNHIMFDDKTPYTIMFGPDKCGFTNKVHFIFRHKNPITGEYEEKHLKTSPPATISKLSTLYTLVVNPDNTFAIYINQEKVSSGSLLEDFSPSVNPPKEIEDKNDKKPSDWVDEAKIADPSASKPTTWDEAAPMYIEDTEAVMPSGWLSNEPLLVNDPESVKPANWNDEDDGDWVPNKISNPKCNEAPGCGPWKRPTKKNPNYKGKWTAPLIDNPAYKGPWARRSIPNTQYFEDAHPHNFEPMAAVGFELWTIQSEIMFDNIFIGHSEADANEFAKRTWAVKHTIEKSQQDAEEEKNKPEEDAEKPDGLPVNEFFDALLEQIVEVMEDLKEDPMKAAQKHAVILSAAIAGLLIVFIALRKILSSGSSKKHVDAGKRKKLDLAEPDDDKKVIKEKENKINANEPSTPKSTSKANESTPKTKSRKD